MSTPAISKDTRYGNPFNSNKKSKTAETWSEFESPFQLYPVGAELFQQGSAANEVFCIDSGIVKLIRLESDGQESIVDLRFPEWLVGVAAVIEEETYLVTAVTITPCRLRRIPSRAFRHLLKSDIEFSWRVHRMHSRQICEQVTRISQLACLSARYRIESFFIQLISVHGLDQHKKNITLPLLLKNSEIASLIAVTPEYLSRMLKQMQTERLIQIGRGQLVIGDPQKLCRPV